MSHRFLKVRMAGIHVADLEQQARSGRLSLRYRRSWLDDPNAAPLSVRMPLDERTFGDSIVSPFVAGLLPDSGIHRRMIGEALGIDHDNDFSMLAGIGRECAGAVSVVASTEEDEPEHLVRPDWDVLGEKRLAAIIRELPQRPLLVEDDDDFRLSLAGVNDKAVVMMVAGEVALPKSGTPSTHVLKIDIPRLPDSIRTENFCLRLAAELGVRTPKSKIGLAEDQVYMTVARYDRRLVSFEGSPRIRRLHQEDFCQALGYPPAMKYEKDGGPSWRECFDLIGATSSPAEDKLRLIDAAILQWLIANPDAHAKNYSLLHAPGKTNLAPIYDLNNAPVFRKHFKTVRPRLAMSIGSERNPELLVRGHWANFAREVGAPPNLVATRLVDMARRLPDAASDLARSFEGTPAWSPILPQVVDDMAERCRSVPARMNGTWSPPADDRQSTPDLVLSP